ncbi:protein DCL, chloroplastic [Phalaenopsis equestris]|uniref:protein DCL, chloroplastic n=1 Tax=Phalaenopsis equestris TaxID=78828 RepID=UPI0009E32695|nr:protein DCL, chloroplastic [Phalaenopsis equestris]
MASAAAILRLRGFPHLRTRALRAALPRRCSVGITTLGTPQQPEPAVSVREVSAAVGAGGVRGLSPPLPPKQKDNTWEHHPDNRRWKEKEGEILLDIEPIKFLTKDILHSDRYKDGERLSTEDEKVVLEKLLAYHPHAVDKIGCGIDSIMVDRHPQFRNSRCLFVVRTDGVWIDFSYQKCLRAYIKQKYPSHAERFIREHFKRT